MEHTSHGSNTKTKVVFTDGKVEYYDFKVRHQSDDYANNNLWVFVDCFNEHLKINGSIIQELRDTIPPKESYWRLPMEQRLALRNATVSPTDSPNNIDIVTSRQPKKIWEYVSTNPLLSAIVAAVVGGVVLATILKACKLQ